MREGRAQGLTDPTGPATPAGPAHGAHSPGNHYREDIMTTIEFDKPGVDP